MAEAITGSSAVEIAGSIEGLVRSGELPPDAPLPTVRELAARLGVSPGTVAAAYRSLRERGMLVARGRRGTRVSSRPPVAFESPVELPEHVRNLATGNPDRALLPDLDRALARVDPAPRLYGEDRLHPGLEALARDAFVADDVPCESVFVAGGAIDAIERILQVHLRPGDRIAVEDPGFTGVLDLVPALGLEAVPVAVDDEGPLPEALVTALESGCEAFVVTPRGQNPLGAALSAARSAALAEVLARFPDVLLIEDDHLFRIERAPYRTLITDGRPRRAAIRSVSKSLGPDLRLAVVAADATTAGRVVGRQAVGARWVSFVLQQLAVALWSDDAVSAAIDAARDRYAERREAVVAALAAQGVAAHGRSGHNVWVPVADETAAVQGLVACGWGVAAGRRFRSQSAPGIRITVADLAPDEPEPLAAAVARVLAPPEQAGRTRLA